MIPFKVLAPVLVGLTGIGWVISGIVQDPRPLTLKDVTVWDESQNCIKSFKPDVTGFQPFKNGCPGGGGTSGNGCCIKMAGK